MRTAAATRVSIELREPTLCNARARTSPLERRRPRLGLRTTDTPQRTLSVLLFGGVAARAHHAEVAQREVIADRIVRVDRTQGAGDLGRHLPAGRRALRQSQALSGPDRVGVERHDQLP